MCIAATRVEQEYALCIPVDLHVSGPDVAVNEERRDAPASCLERPQQPRDNLCEELIANFVHFGVRSPDALLPFEIRPQLATEEFLTRIASLVHQGYNAIECGGVESKLSDRRLRSLVQFFKDLSQLFWLGNVVPKVAEGRQEK